MKSENESPFIFDIEADGLLDEATKIHCLSYYSFSSNEIVSLTDYQEIAQFLLDAECLIGHNIVQYDIPLLEKLLEIKIEAKLIDTLPISWYLFPKRILHGLEAWGDDLGVAKPVIEDWQNLDVEDYLNRCETDVEINLLLWKKISKDLKKLYETSDVLSLPILSYLSFKMDCAREQARSKWKLDIDLATHTLESLIKEREEKEGLLRPHMPPVPSYRKMEPPKKPFKKDGTLSAVGARWFNFLSAQGLDKSHSEPISILTGHSEPNPGSHVQIKDWLFSLGWEPCTFKYEKDDDGSFREIPQVRKPHSGGELTDSVKELVEKEPAILLLEGLSIVAHRISVFEGFLEEEKDGFVKAEIAGLTNTLRFKHRRPCVNLPGIDKPYGKEVRGSLIAREGKILCGSDMVSLEDTTKRHYIQPIDPDFVAEMDVEGFDPHMKLLVVSGDITQEEYDFYTWYKENG